MECGIGQYQAQNISKNAIWRANKNQDIGLQRVSKGLRECLTFS